MDKQPIPGFQRFVESRMSAQDVMYKLEEYEPPFEYSAKEVDSDFKSGGQVEAWVSFTLKDPEIANKVSDPAFYAELERHFKEWAGDGLEFDQILTTDDTIAYNVIVKARPR